MEKRVPISMKLPPDLLARIERNRLLLEYPPDRTAIAERLFTEWCERIEAEHKKRGRK